MDLKRLKIKKEISEIVGKTCQVRDFYHGAINVGKVIAVIGLPSQTFELFAQSGPKIYQTEIDVNVDILGESLNEVDEIAQEINSGVLGRFDSIDLLNIQMLHNFESDVKINGIRLSYVFKGQVVQEA